MKLKIYPSINSEIAVNMGFESARLVWIVELPTLIHSYLCKYIRLLNHTFCCLLLKITFLQSLFIPACFLLIYSVKAGRLYYYRTDGPTLVWEGVHYLQLRIEECGNICSICWEYDESKKYNEVHFFNREYDSNTKILKW